MAIKESIELTDDVYLRQSQLDVEVERIGRDPRTTLTFAPACFFRLENCPAELTLIPMEVVTSDPPFNAIPHKLEIDNRLAVLRMLEEFGRSALWTRTRAKTLEVLVRNYDLRRSVATSRNTLYVYIRLNIYPLPLIIPIRRSVDHIEFREGKCVALETVRVFPL